MGFKGTKAERKQVYDKKVQALLGSYTKALLADADNVGSKQFQEIRAGSRPDSLVLMGKNTLIKRTIRQYAEKTGDRTWDALLPLLVGNVGIIFTKGDLKDVREEIAKYKHVYDNGSVFHPSGLDVSDEDLVAKFMAGVQQATALLLDLDIANSLSLPHIFANCFKNVVAVALECKEFSFLKADKIKEILADPSKFMVAAVAVDAPSSGAAAEKKEEEEEKEEKEESDDDLGISLFD